MLKAGLYALAALGIFALVFALWPQTTPEAARTGATLQGVALTLYPSRDPDAVWRFRAADVTNDPVKGETRLTGLSNGGRWLRGPDGRPVLDATLAAPDLTIDAQDNLLTRQARVTLVQQCANLDLRGTKDQPVRVEQGYGFSAPVGDLDSPNLNGHVEKLRMTFQFVIEDVDNDRSRTVSDLDAPERCVDGRRVRINGA